MKKISILFAIGILINVGCYSQNIDIGINNKIYPVLNNNEEVVLAASEYSGIYETNIGLNLQEHPLNNGSFSHPEFLVLYHFLNMKAGDMQSLMLLYDNESQAILGDIINISNAEQSYQEFVDFEMLSKSIFGKYVRLRYNLINKEGQPIPWILMARKINGRYFLTETMPIEHLFIDVSSVNPYNFSRDEFENINTDGLQDIYYKANGLDLTPVENNDYGNLGIYFRIEKLDGDDDEKEEVKLLQNMKESLQDTADAAFIELWDEENREMLSESEFYKYQIEQQRQFYNQIESLKPLGILKAGKEAVLFYKSEVNGQELPLQMIPIVIENGRFKLTDRLKSYYGWEILNEEAIIKEIEIYLLQ